MRTIFFVLYIYSVGYQKAFPRTLLLSPKFSQKFEITRMSDITGKIKVIFVSEEMKKFSLLEPDQ